MEEKPPHEMRKTSNYVDLLFGEGNHMNYLIGELNKEKLELEKILKTVDKELRKINIPTEKVSISYKGNSLQCYIKGSDKKIYGNYLPIEERDKATILVKKEYYEKLKKNIEKRINILKSTINRLQKNDIYETYTKLGKGKQRLVTPIILSDEQFRAEWESFEYIGNKIGEGDAGYYTERGERVRSKSEKIIADKLYKENIAYRYECPLEIPFVGTFYPDFTILDERRRRNIILEHYGYMDNPEYVNNAITKMHYYTREGYVLGDTFFLTMETSEKPFDSRMLDGIIMQIKHR